MPGDPRLRLDPDVRFSCTTCGGCCANPWLVLCDDAKHQALVELGYADIFEPGPNGEHAIKKGPDGACSQLNEDGLCRIHAEHGERAKPLMCQRFPYVHVASDEHVFVTASFGCKSVREGTGAPLRTEQAAHLFAKDVSEADPSADTVYPLDDERDLTTTQLDDWIAALDLGEDVFDAMQALGGSSEGPISGEARYAFAMTLYGDILDMGSAWERLKGVFRLPKALDLRLRYHSRLLDREIDMARVMAHPGVLPAESHALLVRWMRSKLVGRAVFKDVPFALAGVTRMLLETDAAIYFARALADDRDITHDDVLHAVRQTELFIGHQRTTLALSRLDPRLPGFWRSAAVRADAARLFRSRSDHPA